VPTQNCQSRVRRSERGANPIPTRMPLEARCARARVRHGSAAVADQHVVICARVVRNCSGVQGLSRLPVQLDSIVWGRRSLSDRLQVRASREPHQAADQAARDRGSEDAAPMASCKVSVCRFHDVVLTNNCVHSRAVTCLVLPERLRSELASNSPFANPTTHLIHAGRARRDRMNRAS
jgi:hypothetical protein